MNIQDIANFLAERRQRAMPFVSTGDVVTAIGSDGLQEALTRRWLVADSATGFLQITPEMSRAVEFLDIAARGATPERAEESGASNFVRGHAERSRIDEISAPGTGKPGPALSRLPQAMPATALPTPTTPAQPPAAPVVQPQSTSAPAGYTGDDKDGTEVIVGDNVTVVDEGRTYTGRVKNVNGDRITVSFGPEKADQDYSANDIHRHG